MGTETKNQHYVPKFYLRNFSYHKNGKQIGVFNHEKDFFMVDAKLKTQASKPFYYGADGTIERQLANVETEIAPLIATIIETGKIPAEQPSIILRLIHFAILMSERNPLAADGIIDRNNALQKTLYEMMGDDSDPGFEAMEISTRDEAIQMALDHLHLSVSFCDDLDMKLLVNTTGTPFICSDNPVVKYNQFLEERRWPLGSTGYASLGLQIFLPISPQLALLFYDASIYKVCDKRNNWLKIHTESSVNEINLLQLINSKSILFFNEHIDKPQLQELVKKSIKFDRAHKAHAIVNGARFKDNRETHHQIIRMGASDVKTGLSIPGIVQTMKARHLELGNSAAQLRPLAEKKSALFFGDGMPENFPY